MSTLVTYFSAEGTTKAVAEELAGKLGEYIKGAAVLDAKLVHNADEVENW